MLIIFTGAFVSGCNTVQGFGEDLEEAGEHIEDTAEDAAD
jgi:predicted small secreted protein